MVSHKLFPALKPLALLGSRFNNDAVAFARLALRYYVKVSSRREGPIVYINSVPKAGTHLITSELNRLNLATNSWLHINTRWVNKKTKKRVPLREFELNLSRFEQLIEKVPQGTYFSSHLPYSKELDEFIGESAFRSIFVIRDPRDVLVSSYFYIMNLKRHPAHNFFLSLPNDISRYQALLYGHPEYKTMEPLEDSYKAFSQWTASRNVLTVRFEDLIGAVGGGSDQSRLDILKKMAKHIDPNLKTMYSDRELLTTQRKSATFRAGKVSTWRQSVPKNLVLEIEEACENMVKKLGYPS